jgi:hypothetical protein
VCATRQGTMILAFRGKRSWDLDMIFQKKEEKKDNKE